MAGVTVTKVATGSVNAAVGVLKNPAVSMIIKAQIEELSIKIDGLIELELGCRLPHVTLIATFDGDMAVFTNRRDNEEVKAMLEAALKVVNERWKHL